MEIDRHGGSAILCGIDTSGKGGAAVVTFDRQTYAQRRGVAA
jgi:hypothetical protein